jgi:hypothetical protein
LFFARVNLGTFAGEPCSRGTGDGLGKSGLNCLAAVRETPGRHERIHSFKQGGVNGHGHLRLWH